MMEDSKGSNSCSDPGSKRCASVLERRQRKYGHDRCPDEPHYVAYPVEEDRRLLHTALIKKTGEERKEYKRMETYHALILIQY